MSKSRKMLVAVAVAVSLAAGYSLLMRRHKNLRLPVGRIP